MTYHEVGDLSREVWRHFLRAGKSIKRGVRAGEAENLDKEGLLEQWIPARKVIEESVNLSVIINITMDRDDYQR